MIFIPIILLLLSLTASAQKSKTYQVASPNGANVITIEAGDKLRWSVANNGQPVIAPSPVSMQLVSGQTLGDKPSVTSAKTEKVGTTIKAINYKKAMVQDNYQQITLNCKGNYGLQFRAYNDGVAYRFFTTRKDSFTIANEETFFNFQNDYKVLIPFVRDLRGKEQYIQSYEALYDETHISGIKKDTLAFSPVLVKLGGTKNAVILEADLEDYPGMFITANPTAANSLKGHFPPFVLTEEQGGFHRLNTMAVSRAAFIARVAGTRTFPWRAVVISNSDAELVNSDMVYKLAAPSRIADVSWIKAGKVAWDWWNDWNITGVDFRAGINTPTYKFYIDFAAANGLGYIIMDEGWSDELDVMQLSSNVDLPELISYAKAKGVGIILWASWYAINKKTDEAFARYSAMGIKGFKIDFLDRDDQPMVRSTYDIAQKAAQYKLLVDYHGVFKPTGLQRTYPNVVNYEGVKGLENNKWTPADDVPRYDCTIPFIRMLAGPMDYTPGAMRNATKTHFRPSHSLPISQGTRCHELAKYVVFEAPLQMLADNPSIYKKEQESTDFIAKVPTVFDETVALNGTVGEHVAIARRRGDTWYVAAMTNWTPRELVLDCSFLGNGNYEAVVFWDGINADRDATDYKREVIKLTSAQKLKIQMAPGGGWAARIYPLK